eukprot:SM000084S23141  [mRNA]  locus=s84:336013:338473:- [translate_table: standard]
MADAAAAAAAAASAAAASAAARALGGLLAAGGGHLLAVCRGLVDWAAFALLEALDRALCPVFRLADAWCPSSAPPCYCAERKRTAAWDEALASYDDGGGESGAEAEAVAAATTRLAAVSATLRARRRRVVRLTGRVAIYKAATAFLQTAKRGADEVDTVGTLRIAKAAEEQQPLLEAVSGVTFRLLNLPAPLPAPAGQPLMGRDDLAQRTTELRAVAALLRKALRREKGDAGASKHGVHRSDGEHPSRHRWSDCGCGICSAWRTSEGHLYVHRTCAAAAAAGSLLPKPAHKGLAGTAPGSDKIPRVPVNEASDVIFLHGFAASSSFWVDTVLPHFSEHFRSTHRLYAVDLLGFGRSPKPTDCLYTLGDHVETIQASVIARYGLRSFHIVAHSMGCLVALALAACHPLEVASVTLFSPPYVATPPGVPAAEQYLEKAIRRTLWPPLAFGMALMSHHEHVGRVVCFLLCRNHRLWEPILGAAATLLSQRRVPRSFIADFMQHTHHSAWHIFHNTICGGAALIGPTLHLLHLAGLRVRVIHGSADAVCPYAHSLHLTAKHANVDLRAVSGTDHITVILGREAAAAAEIEASIAREALPSPVL